MLNLYPRVARLKILNLTCSVFFSVNNCMYKRLCYLFTIPQAIIWSIQEINHVNRERAEEMFLEGSKSTVTNAEVEAFKSTLKKKGRVNREEAEKRIRRAERAMAC